LIHGDLTNEEMNQLYNHPKVKCMVNTTKGEGFGRPLLEFTQDKKPIITTGWSGHIDFLKPDMSVLLPGVLNNVHPSAQNKWLIQGSKWFDVDIIALNKALKDMYKNYKQWVIKAKQQGNYAKENFSYTKMKEKFSKILKENVIEAPKQVNLQLPKLKTLSPPKLKLPKLKKIES
jgi:glycosyltransferase involved in cell wall biosynthesis